MGIMDKFFGKKNEETTEFTKKIGEKEVMCALETLRKYHDGKKMLESKIVSNEEFWKLRQWKGTKTHDGKKIRSTSWLFSCIESRYADVMDSYPTCNIRPRQEDDKNEAIKLSSIIPVIMDTNDYEKTYSANARYVLKNGGGVQAIMWNPLLNDGRGDIEIKNIDILNFFWEPGIDDIQKSENVFVTTLISKKQIENQYPETKGKLNGKTFVQTKYFFDDKISTEDKAVVIDWYYKTHDKTGKTVLHYCKFVENILLYSSENDDKPITDEAGNIVKPSISETGWYAHGKYPFVVTNLFPIEGSICGYGLMDIGRESQEDIDLLNDALMRNAISGAAPKTLLKNNCGITEEDLSDPTQQYVKIEASPNDDNVKVLMGATLNGNYVSVYQNKIEELKYCTANQDVNNGMAPSGITAASAVAALQETSGKQARSANKSFYRAYREVCYFVIELIRQFYDTPRVFRISPDTAEESFITYSNSGIKEQQQILAGIDMGMRLPQFDIDVTAEKQNPYKKIENNEFVLQLYGLGFFAPQNSNQALPCLEMMDFDRKEDFIRKIRKNGTMYEQLIQFQRIALELAQKFDPQLANQLAQIVQQSNGGMNINNLPQDSEIYSETEKEEHPFVEKARAQARQSTEAE